MLSEYLPMRALVLGEPEKQRSDKCSFSVFYHEMLQEEGGDLRDSSPGFIS